MNTTYTQTDLSHSINASGQSLSVVSAPHSQSAEVPALSGTTGFSVHPLPVAETDLPGLLPLGLLLLVAFVVLLVRAKNINNK